MESGHGYSTSIPHESEWSFRSDWVLDDEAARRAHPWGNRAVRGRAPRWLVATRAPASSLKAPRLEQSVGLANPERNRVKGPAPAYTKNTAVEDQPTVTWVDPRMQANRGAWLLLDTFSIHAGVGLLGDPAPGKGLSEVGTAERAGHKPGNLAGSIHASPRATVGWIIVPWSTQATQASSLIRAPTGRTRGSCSGPRPPEAVELAPTMTTSSFGRNRGHGKRHVHPRASRRQHRRMPGHRIVHAPDHDPVGKPRRAQIDCELGNRSVMDRPAQLAL